MSGFYEAGAYGPPTRHHRNPMRYHLGIGLACGLMIGAAIGATASRLAFVLAMPAGFVCIGPPQPASPVMPAAWRDEQAVFACSAAPKN